MQENMLVTNVKVEWKMLNLTMVLMIIVLFVVKHCFNYSRTSYNTTAENSQN